MKETKKLYRINRYYDGAYGGKKGMRDTGKTLKSLNEAKKRLSHDEDEIVVFIVESVITKKSLDRTQSMNQIFDGFPNKRQNIARNLVDSTARYENLKNLIVDEASLKKYVQSKRKKIFKEAKTIDDYVAILSAHSFNAVPYVWKYKNSINGKISNYNYGSYYGGPRNTDGTWVKFREYQGDQKLFAEAKTILKAEKLEKSKEDGEKITTS